MWVDVNDTLPPLNGKIYEGWLEESNPVLLFGKTPFGDYAYGIGNYVHDHEESVGDWAGKVEGYEADQCKITHWAELPAPPEVGA